MREAPGDGGQRGQGLRAERAQELARGGGDMAREGFHARLLREHGIGAEGLAQALDGGGGERGGDGRALRMARGVVPQQNLLERRGEVGVGVAEQAGQIVGDRPAAHALVVDQHRLRAAEQDVAGLEIAVDQSLGRSGENGGDRVQFRGDGGDLRFRQAQARAQDVVDEIGVFPGIELGVEAGHPRQARAPRGGQAGAVQAQGDVEHAAVDLPDFRRPQMRQARFQRGGTEILDGEEPVARGLEEQARDGHAERFEKFRVAGIEPVVGAFRRPADQDRRLVPDGRTEKFAVRAAGGEDFDGR